jgi:hypothetical protein
MLSVDEAVGAGCANRRADVLLVQFFLRVAFDAPELWEVLPGRRRIRPDTNPWRPSVAMDGVVGKETIGHIELFQLQFLSTTFEDHAQKSGLKLAQDSRVDPVRDGSYFGARTGVFKTIFALNMAYMHVFGNDSITRIADHPLFPGELVRSLKVSV